MRSWRHKWHVHPAAADPQPQRETDGEPKNKKRRVGPAANDVASCRKNEDLNDLTLVKDIELSTFKSDLVLKVMAPRDVAGEQPEPPGADCCRDLHLGLLSGQLAPHDGL